MSQRKPAQKIIQFPTLRVDYEAYIDPQDLDNSRLDEIQSSLDDIEKLLEFLRNELMLIRMRITG